jgi:hypothetical protein
MVSGMGEIPTEIDVNVSMRNGAICCFLYRVEWNSGTWFLLGVVFVATVVMSRFQVKELSEIRNCTEKLTNETVPIYTALGVVTDVAISAAYGKPYTVPLVSMFGFFGAWLMGIRCPKLWAWSEKTMLLIIPVVIIFEYIWIGWYRRRRVY